MHLPAALHLAGVGQPAHGLNMGGFFFVMGFLAIISSSSSV
jgi:hypothetical protein